MTASLACFAALWQGETALGSDMVRFVMVTGLVLILISVGAFYVLKSVKPRNDGAVSAQIRSEFDKSKDALLLAAQAKKAGKETDEAAKREAERETRERELLKENVDAQRVFSQSCPICRLEMMDDQELVIDPYSGQGYHFACFLSEWPMDTERPKYIYRFPQETVVKSEEMVRHF